MSRWNHHDSLVEWQIIGLGCNLCRHFCPFPSIHHSLWSMCSCKPGRADQDPEVQLPHLPGIPFFHTCCLWNFWSLQPSLHVFLDRLGSPHCEHHWWQKLSGIPSAKVFCCHSEGEWLHQFWELYLQPPLIWVMLNACQLCDDWVKWQINTEKTNQNKLLSWITLILEMRMLT